LQLDPSNVNASFTFNHHPLAANPFDPAYLSVQLTAQARRLPDWTIGWRGRQAFEPPVSPVASEQPLETVTLVPFGSQHMRVSWFPWLGTPVPTIGTFTENFDAKWPQRWTAFGGNWYERDGALHTAAASAGGAKALAMATVFTNVTCEADIAVGVAGDAGLMVRAAKPDIGADAYCGYYAGFSVEKSRVQLGWVSNAWNEIASTPMTFTPGKSYHFKVTAQGSHLKVFVGENDHPVLEVNDDHFAAGMVGVRRYCEDGDKSTSSFANFSARESSSD